MTKGRINPEDLSSLDFFYNARDLMDRDPSFKLRYYYNQMTENDWITLAQGLAPGVILESMEIHQNALQCVPLGLDHYWTEVDIRSGAKEFTFVDALEQISLFVIYKLTGKYPKDPLR